MLVYCLSISVFSVLFTTENIYYAACDDVSSVLRCC